MTTTSISSSNTIDFGPCQVCSVNAAVGVESTPKAAVGVASSPFGPVSFAYCQECLDKPADCECVFEFMYEDAKSLDELIPLVSAFHTFKDGKYMTAAEWWEWRNTQPDRPTYEHHPLDDAEYPDDN